MINANASTAEGSPENVSSQIVINIAINETMGEVEEQVKRLLLRQILDFTNGDKVAAARILGVSLKTVYNRLAAVGIDAQR